MAAIEVEKIEDVGNPIPDDPASLPLICADDIVRSASLY
jgi:hypothetical protein